MEHHLKNTSIHKREKQNSNYKIREISLHEDQVFSIDGDRRGSTILVEKGVLWITQKNDPKDYVLEPGQKFIVNQPGMLLVGGVRGNAAFRMKPT